MIAHWRACLTRRGPSPILPPFSARCREPESDAMFENLSERLLRTVKHLRGQARLTEDNIRDALREVRMALLEADVALPVVRDFIARVKEKALGQEVLGSLKPGQALVGMLPMPSRPGVLPLSIDQMADRAYEYADALLRARGKRPA